MNNFNTSNRWLPKTTLAGVPAGKVCATVSVICAVTAMRMDAHLTSNAHNAAWISVRTAAVAISINRVCVKKVNREIIKEDNVPVRECNAWKG